MIENCKDAPSKSCRSWAMKPSIVLFAARLASSSISYVFTVFFLGKVTLRSSCARSEAWVVSVYVKFDFAKFQLSQTIITVAYFSHEKNSTGLIWLGTASHTLTKDMFSDSSANREEVNPHTLERSPARNSPVENILFNRKVPVPSNELNRPIGEAETLFG